MIVIFICTQAPPAPKEDATAKQSRDYRLVGANGGRRPSYTSARRAIRSADGDPGNRAAALTGERYANTLLRVVRFSNLMGGCCNGGSRVGLTRGRDPA